MRLRTGSPRTGLVADPAQETLDAHSTDLSARTALEQTAPLGRAVIGGLVASMIGVLIVLPAVYALVQHNATRHGGSWHPDDAATA